MFGHMFRYILLFIPLFSLFFACQTLIESKAAAKDSSKNGPAYGVVIHGGAGTMKVEHWPDSLQQAYHSTLKRAVDTAYQLLENGEPSVAAVVAAISLMENSPLFNAGIGAVFTADTTHELDASIMIGKPLQAGAVAGVQTIKNPIQAALAVLERSEHVLLSGRGAEKFARQQGLDPVPNSYFSTENRLNYLRNAKKKEGKHGTVGAVCLDKKGVIAAGTSTGGMTNKKFGRIGDSPIIGAGTYANAWVGVSCTGHGEFFIRQAVAYDVAARMNYLQQPLDKAATMVIDDLEKINGSGGLIAMDSAGNISMPFNTGGMFRAFKTNTQAFRSFIGKEK
jgi:beta-aspartyl-peptidase (threonine type)